MKYMLPALSNWMPSCDVRGITFWCTHLGAVVARGGQGLGDAGGRRRVLQLEQAAVVAGASCGSGAPRLLGRDQGAPGRPEGGVEGNVVAELRAVPDRLGLAGRDVVTQHAALTGLEHGEQELALVRARLVDGVHVPVPAVGATRGELRGAIGHGLLLEGGVAEGDGRRFVGRGTSGRGERREVRESDPAGARTGRGKSGAGKQQTTDGGHLASAV